MNIDEALLKFDALSQETRLKAFRLLVKAGNTGMPAGALSKALETPHNTMSFHLNHLSYAGIISSHREGRSIIYKANFEVIRDFIGFIVNDCCNDDFATIQDDKENCCSLVKIKGSQS